MFRHGIERTSIPYALVQQVRQVSPARRRGNLVVTGAASVGTRIPGGLLMWHCLGDLKDRRPTLWRRFLGHAE